MTLIQFARKIVLVTLASVAAKAASIAPAAPSNLSAAASGSQVALRWSDNSSNEQGFIIEGSASSSSGFSRLASVGAGSVSSLVPMPTTLPYYYRVAAYSKIRGQVAYSAYSNLATLQAVTSTTTSTTTTTTAAPTTTTTSTTTTTLASGSLPYTKPALVNPVSPLSYGAKCDGVTDDTAAFQAAINASDVLIPAGRTCVINSTVDITMSNRHIECGTDAIIKQNTSAGRLLNYYSRTGDRLTGDSIVGCHFIGSNTVAPQADWNDLGKHYNIPVQTWDKVDNFYLAGNTFERFWGQSMFQTNGTPDGGHGDTVIYNTFKSCGYYGPVFVAHTNGLIGNNTMVDCASGIENDDATQYSGGNIVENNTLSCLYGYGGPDMQACAMLTGGVAGNADYTTNIVRNNTISGVSNGLGFQPAQGSRLIRGTNWGVKAAQYYNNTCGPGCVYTP